MITEERLLKQVKDIVGEDAVTFVQNNSETKVINKKHPGHYGGTDIIPIWDYVGKWITIWQGNKYFILNIKSDYVNYVSYDEDGMIYKIVRTKREFYTPKGWRTNVGNYWGVVDTSFGKFNTFMNWNKKPTSLKEEEEQEDVGYWGGTGEVGSWGDYFKNL